MLSRVIIVTTKNILFSPAFRHYVEGMPRDRHYNIPVPTWTCPHCGYVHGQGTVVRIDRHRFRCNGCGRLFPDVPKSKQKTPPSQT
jgi:hypothetical protein